MVPMALSDSEVKTCSKTCLKNHETLKTQYDKLRIEFKKSESDLYNYKRGLTSVEEQLLFYKKNEGMLCDQIAIPKRDASYNESDINALKKQVERLKKEKEDNQFKIDNFENASKSLDKVLGSQLVDNNKKGLGYNVVPPPPTGLFAPPIIDLVLKSHWHEKFRKKFQPWLEPFDKRFELAFCRKTEGFVFAPLLGNIDSVIIIDDDTSDDDVIFLCDIDMFLGEEDMSKFIDKELEDMLEALGPSEHIEASTSSKQAKRGVTTRLCILRLRDVQHQVINSNVIAKTIVAYDGKQAKSRVPIRGCVLGLKVVVDKGNEKAKRSQRRDDKEVKRIQSMNGKQPMFWYD
ncbi:hypothetical protein Tco_1176673 [Tanacetum coccineum]